MNLAILLQIQHENNFLPTSKHQQAAFLVFVCTTASCIAQILSSKNASKPDAILAPVANSIAKDIPSYRSQSKRAKSASGWFGKYKAYCLRDLHFKKVAILIKNNKVIRKELPSL